MSTKKAILAGVKAGRVWLAEAHGRNPFGLGPGAKPVDVASITSFWFTAARLALSAVESAAPWRTKRS